MNTISLNIETNQQQFLNTLAIREGKTISDIIIELIDNYIISRDNKIEMMNEKKNITALMKLSESSFDEWDNEEDDIYDSL